MTLRPLVSVVVPVHNRRQQLVYAVASACKQTLAAAEVIVVDDGSSDGSGDDLEQLDPRVRVIRQHRQGRSAARNAGILAASGDLVAFLDSDDIWLPHKLDVQVPLFFRAGSERVGMVAGHVLAIDGEGAEIAPITDRCRRGLDKFVKGGRSAAACVRIPGVYTSSVILRRSALDEVGWFDPELNANEDWDLWLRIARSWDVEVVPGPAVAKYRVHEGNTSSRAMAEGAIVLARRHLKMEPVLPRSARAHLLVKQARAHRTLGQEREARETLGRAILTNPAAAIAGGATRLLAGSVLAASKRLRRDSQGPRAIERPRS